VVDPARQSHSHAADSDRDTRPWGYWLDHTESLESQWRVNGVARLGNENLSRGNENLSYAQVL
jgi:hypothetical protein